MITNLVMWAACLVGGVGGALAGHCLVERFKARR